MATASLTTTPTQIDSGASDNVSITNTGTTSVVVTRGAQSATLQAGQGTVVYPEGTAVTAATVSGAGSVSYTATAARVNTGGTVADGSVTLAKLDVSLQATLPVVTPSVSTATTGTLAAGTTNRLDATSASLVRTLPSAATAGAGGIVVVKKLDTSTNTITINRAGSDTVNTSGTSRALSLPYEAIHLRSDGVSDWTVVASDTPVAQLDARFAGISSANPYGLAVGRGGCLVPVGVRAHATFDNQDTTGTSITYRQFHPLTDSAVGSVLPVFGNWQSISGVTPADNDAGAVPITVAAAVETSDGVVLPFTFNGSHTATIGAGQTATPDAPLAFGDQVAANDKFSVAIAQKGVWLRVYVAPTTATRTETAGTTSGSSTVTCTNIAATDLNKLVTGSGVPANSYVGAVTAGVSFTLYYAGTLTAVNATVTGSPTITLKSAIPQNLGLYSSADNYTTSAGGADLTTTGSGSVTGGTGSYMYGPLLLLGRARTRKPIVAVLSDSIFDGYSEDFHSPFFGPVARACLALGLPFVKLAKGGEVAGNLINPSARRYRAAFLEGVTHCIVQVGTNDGALTSGAGAGGVTTMQTRLTSIGTYLNTLGIKAYLTTVPARTTSTDSWATTGNQTAVSGSQITYLGQLNDWIRTGPTPYQAGTTNLLDLADLTMSARNSGLWATSVTSDGIHPNDTLMRGSVTTAVQALVATFTL